MADKVLTFVPDLPFSAEDFLDEMHGEFSDNFDDGDQLAAEMMDKAKVHAERLDTMLSAAWAEFCALAGLSCEYVQGEDADE